jgi:uncharacterized membrane protein YphA (DoxX/SURF4 family)
VGSHAVGLRRLGDDPRTRGVHAWLVRLALLVPVVYHGAWNLGPSGAAWWASSSGLPPTLRWVVGAAELAAAIALATGALGRVAALGLVLIFAGAIPQHAPLGFSFKVGGAEPLVVYGLLALAIALEPRR